MRTMHSTAITITLVAALRSTIACTDRLEVGDPTTGGGPASGGQTSSSGGRHSGGTSVTGGQAGASNENSGGSGARSTGGHSNATGGAASASGGFAGEPSTGSGGSWLDEFDPVDAVPLSSDGCPMGPLDPDTFCDSSGLVCGYEFEGNYQECTCFRKPSGAVRWDCDFATASDLCGDEVPEAGADCFGKIGLVCTYPPEIECACGGQTGTWECTNVESVEVPDPPSALDPTTTITEMTGQDREVWCDWYSTLMAGGPGHLPTPDLPVEGGFTQGAGCTAQPTAPCRVVTPVLSVAQCVANLALSECALPVSSLSACLETAQGGACSITEYSCLDYLAEPGCAGTIFVDWAPGGPSCDLRVE